MKTERIAEENLKAAKSKIVNMSAANEMINRLRSQILEESGSAFAAYGNLKLSGRHIVTLK